MTRLTPLILASVSLVACAGARQESPTVGSNGADGDTCRSSNLDQFKGRPADAQLANEVIRASGKKNLQWVSSGTMVTMDYREDRVRVWLDGQNRVERVRCG